MWKIAVVSVALAGAAWAQVTQRVSIATDGTQGDFNSRYVAVISADGRFAAFHSDADNLVLGDTNGGSDVFVRDRQTGVTERVSVDSSGLQANNQSFGPSLSSDGHFVAFYSDASNLVSGDTNASADVFVRDRQGGTTERVSVDSTGVQGDNFSTNPSISADGRYVAFQSLADNLVPGDINGFFDVFVRDRQNGTTELVSIDSGGALGHGDSFSPSISADGRYVTFSSSAPNLVLGDMNGSFDVFVHDRQLGTTERVSVATGGIEGNSDSGRYSSPSISADGRYVAFESEATNLVTGDTNGFADVFVRDRQNDTTERVSIDSGGVQANSGSFFPSISGDGRCVAFASDASNLVSGDGPAEDVFVHDRQLATTEVASVDSAAVGGNQQSGNPTISGDGRYVAFWSDATNLIPEDTNGLTDIYVHDRLGGPNFTSLCDPGMGTVMGCPCSNMPSGSGRGCNNSASTGGAILSASGGTYLSSDSLVFTTGGERSTAFGILLQGTALLPNGMVYGQGIRCVGGLLTRLYAKSAFGGSIRVPNFGAGDPPISARSAAKGDVIQPGDSRYYLVYYRDPIVLGGCPASSTFNATQTGQVTWSP